MSGKPHHDAESEVQPELEGGRTLVFYPRGLNIVWGNDPRYWRLPRELKDPVELVQVSWLEVTGSYELARDKKYEIGFKVSLTQEAFGWNGSKIYVMAKLGRRGRYDWKRASLDDIEIGKEIEIPAAHNQEKLTISTTNSSETKIFFGMYEVWSGKWKGGLKIHHAYIKEVNN